jgi:dTDP-4-amino-4,6-dideoxygalactose transaminase
MHRQPVFADRRVVGGRVSDDLFARGLSLPSGSSLTPAERDRVVEGVLSLAGRGTRWVSA